MSTSGSFTPAGTAPCPAPMTRAALLALRTAGSLRTECHYTVTDGPVIGTAGNTSATTIELHATSATELALEARVHTTFAASAWDGLYDIDAGAAGSIFQLTDDWNNFAEDEDPSAPTVHTQVPWHRGGVNFSGNRFDTAVLTGWDTAATVLTDNTIKGSTVDLTGFTGAVSAFRRNAIRDGSVIRVASNQGTVLQNDLGAAFVSCLSGQQFGFLNNQMRNGHVEVDATTTGHVAVNSSVIGGDSGGYRVVITGFTGTDCLLNGNRLFGVNTLTQELLISGPADTVTLTNNSISAGDIRLNGSGDTDIEGNTIAGSNITKAAGSSGPLNFTRNQFTNAVLSIGAANAAVDNLVDQCTIRGGVLDLRGPVAGGGRNDFTHTTILDLVATVAATATAGLKMDNGVYNKGLVNQNRTAGTQSTVLNDCTMFGIACVVNDNGTVDPGQPVNLNRVQLTDSTVTINNLAAGRTAPDVVSQVDMMASLLFVSGMPLASTVRYGRMLDASLTTAFEVTSFTLDGMVKTAGASQNHRHGSPAFDNWT